MKNTEEKELYGNFAVVLKATGSQKRGILLSYSIPSHLSHIEKGHFCFLPMKSGKNIKNYVGVLLDFCPKPSFPCQNIIDAVPYTNKLSENLISVLNWVSEYYLASIEKIIPKVAPDFLWDVEKYIKLKQRLDKVFYIDNEGNYHLKEDKKGQSLKGEICMPKREQIQLNEEQNEVYQSILQKNNGVCLLHGVTGSGKTEVYLKLAQYYINNNKTVLILVPEIALTPQMSSRFRSVFQNNLAVLHSGITKTEYEREWFRVHLGFVKVVLGVRTSVFTLLKNIGLIIVDEEHDASYKSQGFFPYHARDVAVLRAKKESALCLLGSATPSVETMFNVYNGKYSYFNIKNKYSKNTLENIVIDSKKLLNLPQKLKHSSSPLRSSQIVFGNKGIAPEVFALLREKKAKGEQSMVILNRRGYVNYALCANCSTPLLCPYCSVTTTLHKNGKQEVCHYCDYNKPIRSQCPSCQGTTFYEMGIGTQNIEEQLQINLPELKIARLDRDVMTSNTRLSEIIRNFQLGNTDCLVGTQMLAKGHDFPKVTLVVVLHVEDSLFLPDFRASERTFQLLTQAMGRAGRGSEKGVVVLQSLIVGHPVIEMSLSNNVEGFLKRELSLRKLGFHPPYSRQILFEINHIEKEKAILLGNMLKEQLISFWKSSELPPTDLRLSGPYLATLERLNKKFRVQLCISFKREIHPLRIIPKETLNNRKLEANLRIEVDPYSFL